jgi:hypothetical protein
MTKAHIEEAFRFASSIKSNRELITHNRIMHPSINAIIRSASKIYNKNVYNLENKALEIVDNEDIIQQIALILTKFKRCLSVYRVLTDKFYIHRLLHPAIIYLLHVNKLIIVQEDEFGVPIRCILTSKGTSTIEQAKFVSNKLAAGTQTICL